MKLTAKHLGLLLILLFGVTHADAPADGSVATLCADSIGASCVYEEAITAPTSNTASNEVVLGEVVKQATPTEEIRANLTQVSNALKDGFQAAAVIASGMVDAAGAVLSVVNGTVNFAVAVAKVTWFAGMIVYIAVNALVEFSQTAYASK